MTVWTISFEAGTGGELVARLLADRAGAPLIDRQAVVAIAHAFGIDLAKADDFEHHPPGGRLEEMGLAAAALVPLGAGAVAQLRAQPTLRAVTEEVIREAGRQRCVILGRGGFLILADHPGAIHMRLRAPLEWRVSQHARHECVSHDQARRDILTEDRARDTYLRRLYGRRFADLSGFHHVIDASRFSVERTVEAALAAGGIDVQVPDETEPGPRPGLDPAALL